MKIINLRLHYPHCQQDKLVEVSEEVFDVLCQSIREMRNYERRKQYHRAFYSLAVSYTHLDVYKRQAYDRVWHEVYDLIRKFEGL